MSQENVDVLRTSFAQAAARRVDCDRVTHSRDRGQLGWVPVLETGDGYARVAIPRKGRTT